MKKLKVFQMPTREFVAYVTMVSPGKFNVESRDETMKQKLTSALDAIFSKGKLLVRGGFIEEIPKGQRNVTTSKEIGPEDPDYLKAVGYELISHGFSGIVEET